MAILKAEPLFALDMTHENLFRALATTLIKSGGTGFLATQNSFEVHTPPDGNGVSEAIAFSSAGGIGYGDIKFAHSPKTFYGPVSGKIDAITVSLYDAAKTGPGETPYTTEYSLSALDLDVGRMIRQIFLFDPVKEPKKFAAAVNGVLADVFRGADTITGSDKADRLEGFDGRDTIYGNGGNDVLYGGDGRDFLFGGAGADTLYGNHGSDRLNGGLGADKLYGILGGSDWASYADAAARVVGGATTTLGVTANLAHSHDNRGAEAVGDRYVRIENLQGSAFDDRLIGNGGRNILQGGAGADYLKGNGGADTFVFGAEFTSSGFDTIGDFKPGHGKAAGDVIGLDEDVFLGVGSVAENDGDGRAAILAGAFVSNKTGLALEADDRIIYNSDTGQVFYDADGNGSTSAAVQIAQLVNAPTLTAAAFRVVDFDLLI